MYFFFFCYRLLVRMHPAVYFWYLFDSKITEKFVVVTFKHKFSPSSWLNATSSIVACTYTVNNLES